MCMCVCVVGSGGELVKGDVCIRNANIRTSTIHISTVVDQISILIS